MLKKMIEVYKVHLSHSADAEPANLYAGPSVGRMWLEYLSLLFKPIDQKSHKSLTALKTDLENYIYANFANEAPLQDHEAQQMYTERILWWGVNIDERWMKQSSEEEQSINVKMKIRPLCFWSLCVVWEG